MGPAATPNKCLVKGKVSIVAQENTSPTLLHLTTVVGAFARKPPEIKRSGKFLGEETKFSTTTMEFQVCMCMLVMRDDDDYLQQSRATTTTTKKSQGMFGYYPPDLDSFRLADACINTEQSANKNTGLKAEFGQSNIGNGWGNGEMGASAAAARARICAYGWFTCPGHVQSTFFSPSRSRVPFLTKRNCIGVNKKNICAPPLFQSRVFVVVVVVVIVCSYVLMFI